MQPTVRLEHTLLAVEEEHDVHALIELAVPEAPQTVERPPLRIALVLDRSGSMAGDKLAVAKRCAHWLGSRLRAQDELAVIAYADNALLLAPLSPVGPEHAAAISSIGPGGSTNLSGGWLKGVEQLRGRGGTILLLSDGLANVGLQDPRRLAEIAGRARAESVATSTIGFGADFDEDLMTAMADAGGGNAHFAETPDDAPAIFAKEIEGLASVVAQNVSLELRPQDEVEVVHVLNDYPAVAVPGGIQIQLGDAYGGETRRVVLRLHVPRLAELGVRPIADIILRYASLDPVAQHEVAIPIVVNAVSASEAAAATPDADVREHVLVLEAARARDEAIRLADAGDADAARRRLTTLSVDLASAGLTGLAAELDADARGLGRYDRLMRKRMRFASHASRRGR